MSQFIEAFSETKGSFCFFLQKEALSFFCARPRRQPRAQEVLFCKKEPKNFHS
jgi:hypothetical protein